MWLVSHPAQAFDRTPGGQPALSEPLRGVRHTKNWCTQEDSNLWPLPSEGSALSS